MYKRYINSNSIPIPIPIPKDIRGVQIFQIGDLSSFLAGGMTCIRREDLFVSWSGSREDPGRRLDSIKHFDEQCLNSLQILEAKTRIFV